MNKYAFIAIIVIIISLAIGLGIHLTDSSSPEPTLDREIIDRFDVSRDKYVAERCDLSFSVFPSELNYGDRIVYEASGASHPYVFHEGTTFGNLVTKGSFVEIYSVSLRGDQDPIGPGNAYVQVRGYITDECGFDQTGGLIDVS